MSRRPLPDTARRGWCPGLARPMPTGDGLLARVHPLLGVLTLAQARAVAEGGRLYGNGHLDLTARANVQIRGVSEATRAPLAALLDAAGLGDARTDGGPQRLTITGPLAGHDPSEPFDVAILALAIEEAGREVAGLPAKTLVAVGTMMEEADLSVVPLASDRVVILPASGAVPAEEYPLADGPAAVAALLAAFTRTGRRRMRDITAAEWADALRPPLVRAERSNPGQRPASEGGVSLDRFAPLAMPERLSALPAALSVPRSGRMGNGGEATLPAPGLSVCGGLAILALDAPFGRCTVAAFERLISCAETVGAPEIRLTPSRGAVLLPSRPERVDLAVLSADFITGADDPRRAVAACTGAPACASGSTPTLADAARLAEAFRPLAARGLSAHVSGCAKGCARPGPSDLTLVGRDGFYGIVVGGNPGDPPTLQIPIEPALERLGRAANLGIAAAFAPEPGDTGRNRRPA